MTKSFLVILFEDEDFKDFKEYYLNGLKAKESGMKYRVEQLFVYGWDDAGWSIDDEPEVFDSIEEAQEALDLFFEEIEEAVELGELECGYEPEEFRIAEVK